ncbi:MAG TPA: ABC transporter ATP-binding protein [Streptosporangiaceae bacterium]|jgi:peptide/nickel transport system ATP-binding protein|nr:ABC transporter ATP-binding protein [Streptosporangiaceae bacterium]
MIIDAAAQADSLLSEGLVVDADHVDVTYAVRGEDRLTIKDVSFQIGRQESFGLVGESGCGKTTMALAIARYLPRNGRVSSGSITVAGQDVGSLSNEALRKLRARTISMVYQEPGRALNPSIRIGRQVAEVFEIAGLSKQEAADRAEEALRTVQISDPGRVLRRYPHQLSGGMLQRVIIAMALAAEPSLLILDEPTTALDATVEAEILELVSALREEFHTAVLFISHNLAVIAKMCDRVGVMYAGELVEQGPAQEVFDQPRHPYTVGLLRCIPRRGQRRDRGRLDTIPGFLPAPGSMSGGCVFEPRCALAEQRCRDEAPPMYPVGPDPTGAHRASRCHYHEKAPTLPRVTPENVQLPAPDLASQPVISLRDVSKTFVDRHESVHALVGIDLDLHRGETLGLVGESGSGKTTLARVLLGLTAADQGSVLEMSGSKLGLRRSRDQLRAMQIIFQNPDSALNRRHSVRHIISRALTKLAGLSGPEREASLHEIISSVRMQDRHLGLRPAQLSGGLKQRVAIARAFAGNPNVLVCDEPTSALDVSVQAAILNLLSELQGSKQVTYLFISHDLGVVRYLSDRIAVLYLGRLMEYGEAETVFTAPHHPYTEALLSAVPSLEGTPAERIILSGEIPSPANPPSGCVFHTRCPRRLASGICESVEPPLAEAESGHFMRCHIPPEELRELQNVETQ